MSDLNILIVEGNIREDSEFFIKAAGASAADNLKNLILKIEPSTSTEIINPGHDDETTNALKDMSKYNGIVFTGGAMRLNDMTDVIKKHINFASNCFTQKKKILAICWGLQVCSTAAGGKVNPGKNGAHIGIASDVIVNNEGEKHFIYKDKKKIFTSPAFNFDEVSELPKNAILLSSDKVNNVMGVSFNVGNSEITGLQYHPDYEYFQMINLIAGRKDRLFKNKNFLLIAKSLAPSGFVFNVIALVTGSIWGKPTWGTWWAWDARITSMLILVLFYSMYILAWRIYDKKEQVIKITSIIAIVGVINVPIIKFSVDWWSTLHQNSSVNILSETSIHPSMLVPLLIMTAAFILFSLLIFLMKYNTELIKIKNKGLDRL